MKFIVKFIQTDIEKIFCPVTEALIDNFEAYTDYEIHSTEIAYEIDEELWKSYTKLKNIFKMENQSQTLNLRICVYFLVLFLGWKGHRASNIQI